MSDLTYVGSAATNLESPVILRRGHVPYAFVVLRPGASATENDLKQFALANGPAYQHPRRVFFLQQLPLAGTNKIDRERLRAWVANGTLV